MLPKISSNTSVFPTEPDADPIGEWLESIEKIKREVPDDVLVLPAHNESFRGLHARLDRLAQAQRRSVERLREALREPRRTVDVFGALFARPIGRRPRPAQPGHRGEPGQPQPPGASRRGGRRPGRGRGGVVPAGVEDRLFDEPC